MAFRYPLAALLVIALGACKDRNVDSAKMSAPNCQERSLPFDMPESTASDQAPSSAFAFSGFRLGDGAAQVESTVRDRYASYLVRRAECSDGSLQMSLGSRSREDGQPVCDKFGSMPCELYRISLSKRESGMLSVSSLSYVARFAEGRPTKSVMQESEAARGKPFWQYSMQKSSGWAGVELESTLVWTDRTDAVPGRLENERFANAVYDALGPGKYFTVHLTHGTEDTNTTYAMAVEAFVKSK